MNEATPLELQAGCTLPSVIHTIPSSINYKSRFKVKYHKFEFISQIEFLSPKIIDSNLNQSMQNLTLSPKWQKINLKRKDSRRKQNKK